MQSDELKKNIRSEMDQKLALFRQELEERMEQELMHIRKHIQQKYEHELQDMRLRLEQEFQKQQLEEKIQPQDEQDLHIKFQEKQELHMKVQEEQELHRNIQEEQEMQRELQKEQKSKRQVQSETELDMRPEKDQQNEQDFLRRMEEMQKLQENVKLGIRMQLEQDLQTRLQENPEFPRLLEGEPELQIRMQEEQELHLGPLELQRLERGLLEEKEMQRQMQESEVQITLLKEEELQSRLQEEQEFQKQLQEEPELQIKLLMEQEFKGEVHKEQEFQRQLQETELEISFPEEQELQSRLQEEQEFQRQLQEEPELQIKLLMERELKEGLQKEHNFQRQLEKETELLELQSGLQELQKELQEEQQLKHADGSATVKSVMDNTRIWQRHYKKLIGFANMRGEMYETKLAALLFARGLGRQEEFFITCNMEAAGAFDDIVLKFGPRTLFLQLKHQENVNKEIKEPNLLLQEKGKFSLLRYYQSYCELKERWTQDKDLQLCGRFEDCFFIVYTNAVLTEGVGSEVGIADWHGILSSGGKCFSFTENTCPLKCVDTSSYKEFVSQLRFFTEQASENQLDDLIREELITLCGTDRMYTSFLEGVENWWRNSDIYLTDKIQFWQDIVHDGIVSISELQYKKFKALGINFNDDQVTLLRTFMMFTQILYINTEDTNNHTILTCLKVYNSLTSGCHLLVDASTFDSYYNEIIALWSRWCDLLVLMGVDVKIDMLADVLRYQGKRLVIVANNFSCSQPQYKYATLHDHVTFEQLDRTSQDHVLASVVCFQGHAVPLGAIAGSYRNFVPTDVIVQLLTDKVVLGDALTGDLDYYIPRSLRLEAVNATNIYANVDSVMDVPIRKVIISAEPGMGKSSLLTHLALCTKNTDPSMWMFRVNLNDFTQQLNRLPTNLKLQHAFKFLLEISGLRDEWTNFFKYKLESMENVSILFDGYDEISPTHADTVAIMLKCLQSTQLQNLWITTRPVMKQKLQLELSTQVLTLEPFSRTDQVNFLFKFWNRSMPHVEKCILSRFIDDVLNLIEVNLNDIEKEFMAIPLQCMMMSEAFENHLRNYNETGDSKLPQRFDLLQLYNYFVERKLEIYYVKNNVDLTKPGNLYNYDQVKEQFLQNHMLSALVVLLPNLELKFDEVQLKSKIKNLFNSLFSLDKKVPDPLTIIGNIKPFLTNIEQGIEKTGIIKQVLDDRPVFIHRTFAEYFAALWFVRNFEKIRKYLKTKLFHPNFQIVRNFLDRILAERFELHAAVLNYDKDAVQTLLSKQQCDVNMRDEGGRTALHLAVMCFADIRGSSLQHTMQQIMEILLEHGANPDIEDKILCWRPLRMAESLKAWTAVGVLLERQVNNRDLILIRQNKDNAVFVEEALKAACSQGCVQLVAFMMKFGIPVDHKVNHNSMLHVATGYGHLKLVQFLITHYADIEARDFAANRTPLMTAASMGHLEILEYLVERGAKVSACDNRGCNALFYAAASGRLDVFKFLMQHDADVMSRNETGDTVLHFAAGSDRKEVTQHILDTVKLDIDCYNNLHKTPLWIAAMNGCLEVTRFLCERRADLHVRDSVDGYTPLHIAASRCNVQIVQCLVECGSNINECDRNLCTPLHVAARESCLQVVQYLVQHGSSTIAKDRERNTALMTAALNGKVEVLEYLSQQTADLTSCDSDGNSILHVIAVTGNAEVTRHILNIPTLDINCCNYKDQTALWRVALCGHLQVAQLLCEYGADLYVCDSAWGYTPLHVAARQGYLNIAKCLIEHGASTALLDKERNTPLDLAIKWNSLDVARFLKFIAK